MPTLWNNNYSKDELTAFTSTLSSIGGVRPFVYDQGKVKGMRGIDVWTGGGLRFTLWPDRGLDIGPAWFKDRPVSWRHPALGTPSNFEPSGLGWLRTFGGGLMTTCGLLHIGAPDEYKGKAYGLHGRISHIPAENIRIWREWQGDDYVLIVEGEIRQTVLFGENLLLKRRIETALGSKTLTLKDVVVNEGGQATPHSLLYHCNIGFPIVSPSSQLIVHDKKIEPRTPAAAAGVADHLRFESPKIGYEEQVFFHYPEVGPDGFASAVLFNPDLRFGVRLQWSAESLPVLTQWKMMGKGEYVCGLEPGTHAMAPWKVLAEKGLPQTLAPGEEKHYEINLKIIDID